MNIKKQINYKGGNLNQYIETYSNDRAYDRSLQYDLDGNMTNIITWSTPGSNLSYTWDGENRMTSAHNTSDDTYITYDYDYQGRMVQKVVNNETNSFVWMGNHIIAELTDSSTNLYTWANGETLCADLNGETVFYAHDANKNVTDLVDDTGDIVAHYEYSPFGVITDQSEELASLNPFRFSNEDWDSITGQIEYEQRKYLPALGKFMSRDPIGVQGGINEYAICANDLINFADRLGMSKSFYAAGGSLAVMFRLAAEEQHITKVFYSDRQALNAKNQTEDWGPLFIGGIKDVEMFTGNKTLDANSIVNEAGKIYIYSHGSEDGNDIDTGVDNITPADIEWAASGCFDGIPFKGIWAISCHFGEKGGGAQQWHDILGMTVIGHEGESRFILWPYLKYSNKVQKNSGKKIFDEFYDLTIPLYNDSISYDEFYDSWENLFNKWKDKGCIEQAYWHVYHHKGYKYNTYNEVENE